MGPVRIALVGDFDPGVTAHRAIEKCFLLAAQTASLPVEPVWLATESIVPRDQNALRHFGGFWCIPASPYRNTEGALWAIQLAREHNFPFLGTCGGFQHALLEYAHHVLRLPDAEHAETNPEAAFPLLTHLQCSLVEASQKVLVTEPGAFREAYGADSGEEGFRCNYGLNPKFEHLFKEGPMQIAARSVEGEARGFQLQGHPFFLGTLFQPERRALEGTVHPLVGAFFTACAKAHRSFTEGNEDNNDSLHTN
jgi:CTP synthase (UTP-ammonia lyase)